eukprot:Nk52_evm2s256 gene=Nk52_evmTU2s256
MKGNVPESAEDVTSAWLCARLREGGSPVFSDAEVKVCGEVSAVKEKNGWMGETYTARVQTIKKGLDTCDTDKEGSLRVFIKTGPPVESELGDHIFSRRYGVQRVECDSYKKHLPGMVAYEKRKESRDYCANQQTLVDMLPKVYSADFYEEEVEEEERQGKEGPERRNVVNSSYIIMEDLRESSYEIIKEGKDLTKEHLKTCAKALGRFHVVGHGYLKAQLAERKSDSGFNSADIPTWVIYTSLKSEIETQGQRNFEAYLNDLRVDGDEDLEKPIRVLSSRFGEIFDEITQAKGRQGTDPMQRFLLHGDFWTNNIMFSSKEYKNEGYSIKMIDFGFFGRGNPVMDFKSLLLGKCSPEQAREWLDDLYDAYYEGFVNSACELEVVSKNSVPDYFQFDKEDFIKAFEQQGYFVFFCNYLLFYEDYLRHMPEMKKKLRWANKKFVEYNPEIFQ